MKKLNNKGYLTVEIILAATIAFTIAFFLIEITVNFSNASDNYYVDTIFLTDKSLIIDNIKTRIQDDIDDKGIIKGVNCNNKICTITYENGSSELKYENNSIKYNEYSKEIKNVNYEGMSVSGSFNEGDYIKIVVKFDNVYTNNNYDINILIKNSEEEVLGQIGEYITNLYINNKNTTVTNNGIEYQYATNVNLMNDRRGSDSETTTSLDGGNIRYYGSNPDNYIDIGDRTIDDKIILWRIIGAFDGEVRIVRNESIGNYAWDTSSSDVNNGYGVNEWGVADIMKLLNPEYTSETIGGSLWWNGGSGNCYKGQNNGSVSCNFTSSGLSEEANKYVIDQILYLGGFDTYQVFANQAYANERGNNVIQNPSDGISRSVSFKSKVGLPYPSDFGYASDFSNSNCQGDLSAIGSCAENWMSTSSDSWTISPLSTSAQDSIYINSGALSKHTVRRGKGIYPVLTLSNSAIVKRGKGTQAYPYKIK